MRVERTVRPYSIRPAVPGDGPAAAQVVETVFREYGFGFDDDYMSDLYNLGEHFLAKGNAFWVATLKEPAEGLEKDAIIGTCAVELYSLLPGQPGTTVLHEGTVRAAGSDCSLERLYVLPSARNLGLGSDLLRLAIQHGLSHSRTWMEIWSDKKLTLAHRLYEQFGAIRVGERICNDPDQSPEWGMALELKKAN